MSHIPVKEFFTAGNAIFTLEVPPDFAAKNDTNPHYTYRIRHKAANDDWPEAWFLDLLAGPDNLSSYAYIGKLNPETGAVKLTRGSKAGNDAWSVRLIRRALFNILNPEGKPEKITDNGFKVYHIGRCGRCGKPLTRPDSIRSGLGPVCANKT